MNQGLVTKDLFTLGDLQNKIDSFPTEIAGRISRNIISGTKHKDTKPGVGVRQ